VGLREEPLPILIAVHILAGLIVRPLRADSLAARKWNYRLLLAGESPQAPVLVVEDLP
jgi:hypothetical protein